MLLCSVKDVVAARTVFIGSGPVVSLGGLIIDIG